MKIRNRYYDCFYKYDQEYEFGLGELYFIGELMNHINSPFIVRYYKKYTRNFLLYIIKICFNIIDSRGKFPYRQYRQLPISLNTEDIFNSVNDFIKERMSFPVTFHKDIEPKEREQLKQQSIKKRREECDIFRNKAKNIIEGKKCVT